MAYITINKRNFFENLDTIALQAKGKEKIALVLKDNAYGHGLLEMAKLAHEYGITKVVVQKSTEAELVEALFEYILVLADFPKYASQKIRYTINELNAIEKFPNASLVELKVNTGMNRNGIEIEELSEALERIASQGLVLEAIFTHHGCADELYGMYELQKERFKQLKMEAPMGLRYHSCNSAALFREKDFDEDMARVGIAAYGCLELPRKIANMQLKPVLSLYANRLSSRKLKQDEHVGYSATYTTHTEQVVSNYDIGYGDGFLRTLSNLYMTPEEIEIAGRISMDNSSFLTDKEELLLFNDARDVAKKADTISYEILTSLKKDIERRVV